MAPLVEITESSYDRLFRSTSTARSSPCRRPPGRWSRRAGAARSSTWRARRAAAARRWSRLLRHQGGGDQPDPVGRARPDQAPHQRQRHRARRRRWPHWDGVDALFAKYEDRPLGEKKRLVGEAVPYGRMGTAEDLVGMAVFLASRRPTTSSPRPQCRRRQLDELSMDLGSPDLGRRPGRPRRHRLLTPPRAHPSFRRQRHRHLTTSTEEVRPWPFPSR